MTRSSLTSPPRSPPIASCALLALSLACASPSTNALSDELATVDAQHRTELQAFVAEQRRHDADHSFPARYEVPGLGVLLVKDCTLIGWSSKAFLRVEFTLLNSVRTISRSPVVTLRMRDPATDEEAWSAQELAIPFGLNFTKDSTYTGSIEVPTQGLHRREGWEWSLEVGHGEPEQSSS